MKLEFIDSMAVTDVVFVAGHCRHIENTNHTAISSSRQNRVLNTTRGFREHRPTASVEIFSRLKWRKSFLLWSVFTQIDKILIDLHLDLNSIEPNAKRHYSSNDKSKHDCFQLMRTLMVGPISKSDWIEFQIMAVHGLLSQNFWLKK